MTTKIKNIPFSEPYIDEQEIEEVVKVLRGKWITTGAEVEKFEKSVREHLDVATAIALSSGTAALEVSLSVHGVGEGDQVLTTAYTFASTVLAIIHRRVEPVFADVEPGTFNISPAKIEELIHTGYRKTPEGLVSLKNGKILRGIIPVHFGGQPVDLETINEIARHYNLFIIEDAAHAIGAVHRGIKVGKSSNLVCFSFYSNKNVTTGEGGMIVTDSTEFEEGIRRYALHGLSKTNKERYQDGLPFYDIVCPGYKANLTDIQAALGVIQIKKLQEITEKRNQVAQWYDRYLAGVPQIERPIIKPYNQSARHLYPILLSPQLKSARDDVIVKLREKGICPSVHFIPVHFHTFFKEHLETIPQLPVTEDLFAREISLPMFPGLSEEDVKYVSESLNEIVSSLEEKKG